jgi:hypothetical protein
MLSPRVISEGIFNVSSISDPALIAMSVKKKAPRELTSCVKPNPSTAVETSRKETGKLNPKRCPIRRSTPAGGVVMVVSIP